MLYTDAFREQLNRNGDDELLAVPFRDYAERVKTGEQLDAMLYIDSKTYLPGDILT